MNIWILIVVTTLGPNKFLYDPYLETIGEPACVQQAEFYKSRNPEAQTFCVKKK